LSSGNANQFANLLACLRAGRFFAKIAATPTVTLTPTITPTATMTPTPAPPPSCLPASWTNTANVTVSGNTINSLGGKVYNATICAYSFTGP
jgi:hypothetical protein